VIGWIETILMCLLCSLQLTLMGTTKLQVKKQPKLKCEYSTMSCDVINKVLFSSNTINVMFMPA
jgi:hypothetical protein